MSEEYNKVKKQVIEKSREEILNKKQLVILEQARFNHLRETVGKCERCGATENLTCDHIVPKYLLSQFGIDTEREFFEENMGILCKRCNIFKSNRLDFSNPKTKELLLFFVDRL